MCSGNDKPGWISSKVVLSIPFTNVNCQKNKTYILILTERVHIICAEQKNNAKLYNLLED